MNLEKGISVPSGNETEKPRPFRFNEGLITRFKNFVHLTAQDPSSRGVVTNQRDWACGLMCLPPRPGKRASPGGSPSTPKEPASRVASKMNVEFKTRAGDKWTSLRHFDSGPWSGGGNPHWTSINITLRNVKNNDGIGERKKRRVLATLSCSMVECARAMGLPLSRSAVHRRNARPSRAGQCCRHRALQVPGREEPSPLSSHQPNTRPSRRTSQPSSSCQIQNQSQRQR